MDALRPCRRAESHRRFPLVTGRPSHSKDPLRHKHTFSCVCRSVRQTVRHPATSVR